MACLLMRVGFRCYTIIEDHAMSFDQVAAQRQKPTLVRWAGRGVAFTGRGRRLACTLLACWEPGYKDPWLLVADLAPEASEAAWYGLRAWIEQSFKVVKRGGWQWQRTRMSDAQRATRLWLMLALATLWLLSVGGEAEATIPESTLPEVDGWRPPRRHSVSVFRRGWYLIVAAWWRQAALPLGRFFPEPWPTHERHQSEVEPPPQAA